MAFRSEPSPDYLRGVRRVLLGVVAAVLVALFLLWRIDNARVEQLRVSLVDRFVPSFAWTVKPVAATARMLADLRAYGRVYEQNAELRRELQRMQGWREAALQLEQKNARLLALNNVRLNPRLTFVTGEVMADAGSPFRRSATVNVGRIDGVTDGSAALDGLGLVGRIAGVGERSARIILLNDGSSRVPAVIRPVGPARDGHRRQRPGAGARVRRPGRRAPPRRPGGELRRRRALSAGHPDRPGRRSAPTAASGCGSPPTTASSTSCGWCARCRRAPVEGPGGLIGPLLAGAAGARACAAEPAR